MPNMVLPVDRVINAGGIPQNNAVLNQVYADVLGKPVLVPAGVPTSLGSAIFALLAAGAFPTIEAAQAKLCLKYTVVLPRQEATAVYEELFLLYRKRISRWAHAPQRLCRWVTSCPSCAGSPAKLRAIDSKLSACRSLQILCFSRSRHVHPYTSCLTINLGNTLGDHYDFFRTIRTQKTTTKRR